MAADRPSFGHLRQDAVSLGKFCSRGEDDRAMSSEGYVAPGSLASARLARDRGFPIEVDSQYLPKALLDLAWAGEIDT
ncbi:Imm49 family immunity protein [Streptomyces sp. NPDC002853]